MYPAYVSCIKHPLRRTLVLMYFMQQQVQSYT
ncbi:hypothetical protein BH11BAC6_BH11BAC6_10080 [soil metagenome]